MENRKSTIVKGLMLALGLVLVVPAAADRRSSKLLGRGDYPEAIRNLEKAVKARPADRDTSLLLARAYRQVGRYLDAVTILERIDSPAAASERAEILALRGRHDEAIRILRKVLAGRPDDVRAACNLGLSLLARGKRAAAMKQFEDVFDGYNRRRIRDASGLLYTGIACRQFIMRASRRKIDRRGELEVLNQDIFPAAISRDPFLVEAYDQMGRIWIDAFDGPNAKEIYEKARKINPNHPDLLVGEAAAFALRFTTRNKIIPNLHKALSVNPHHPEALALLALHRILDGRHAEGLTLARRALAVNPEHIESLAVIGGYHYLTGNRAEYARAEGRALSANPAGGQFHYIAAQVLLSKRQFDEAVKLTRKAVELDPTHWHAMIALGTNLLRTASEEEGKKWLEKVQANFKFHVQTVNMLRLLSTYNEYVHRITPAFRIRIHVSEDSVLRDHVTRLLHEAHEALTRRYRFRPQGKVLFEMFKHHGDFAVRTLGLEGLGALGACFGKVVTMISPRAIPMPFNWTATAWHEYAHVITLQLSRYRVPRWFTEGLSEWEEVRRNPSWRRPQHHALYSAWSSKRMRGIRTLNAGFTRPRYANEIEVCYFQAGFLCEYIETTFGFEKIRAMLLAYAAGHTTEQVIPAVLGVSLDAFDRGFVAWMRKKVFDRMSILPSFSREDLENLQDAAEERPDDAPTLARLALAYYQHGKRADAEIQAGKAIARNASLAEPYLVLGRIFYSRKRYSRAMSLFSRAFALGSRDFYAHLLTAFVHQRNKDQEAAARHMRLARQAFPFYVGASNPFQTLARYHFARNETAQGLAELEAYLALNGRDFATRLDIARRYRNLGNHARAVKHLSDAHEIQLFVADSHLLLADGLTQLGRHAEARREYLIAVELKPKKDLHVIHTKIGELCVRLKDLPRARTHLKTALRIQPGYAPATRLLAEIGK